MNPKPTTILLHRRSPTAATQRSAHNPQRQPSGTLVHASRTLGTSRRRIANRRVSFRKRNDSGNVGLPDPQNSSINPIGNSDRAAPFNTFYPECRGPRFSAKPTVGLRGTPHKTLFVLHKKYDDTY
ncbi:MAG: hypothetical protein M5U15_05115 [Kiritimatiellae bacterium]|nr:hypothetical protein [Kiritimatiellia bacterium]